MTERERLIELIDNYTEYVSARDIHNAEFDEKFADYLIENGVIIFPCKVEDLIDKVISHNSIVVVSVPDENEEGFSNHIYRGMAWEMPEEIKNLKFKYIYSCVAENIIESDAVYIEAEKH